MTYNLYLLAFPLTSRAKESMPSSSLAYNPSGIGRQLSYHLIFSNSSVEPREYGLFYFRHLVLLLDEQFGLTLRRNPQMSGFTFF